MPRFRFLVYALFAFGAAGFYFFANDVPLPPWQVWAVGLGGGAAHVFAYKDNPNSFQGMPTWVGILAASVSIAGFLTIAASWLFLLHPTAPWLIFLAEHSAGVFGTVFVGAFVFFQWLIKRNAPN